MTLSNIEDHECFPDAVGFLQSELMQRHRFYVRALLVALGVQLFTRGAGAEQIRSVALR